MRYEPNTVYHIYNQGNNRQKIFFTHANYLYFIKKMRTHLLPNVDILCYCLMPNHFHWLVYTKEEACAIYQKNGQSNHIYPQQNLSQSIGVLLSSYTHAINRQEKRSGSLFRSRTKAKDGTEGRSFYRDGKARFSFTKDEYHYARICFNYIHNNPVKANICEKQENWVYSSAADYVGIRNGTLCNKHLTKGLLFENSVTFRNLV